MLQAGSSPKADAFGGVGRSIFAAENVQQAWGVCWFLSREILKGVMLR